MKHGKAVPAWSCPKEVWELILKKALDYYECRTEEEECEMADELVELLVDSHVLQDTPNLWHYAEGVLIDKGNGKSGPRATRVVAKLEPVGKLYYKRVWDCTTIRSRRHYAVGFESRRRREQAIVVQEVNQWRCRQRKRELVTVLHEVANAFPSSYQHNLAEMLLRKSPRSVRILKKRYRKAVVVMNVGRKLRMYRIRGGPT